MGFLAPWFLGGLAALGIPVFVHLLRKHISVPRPVGSLMFFERGLQSSTRHRRLRHLLLFALRFASVLLVVLAFADPFIRRAATSSTGSLLVIVLDNSFSMRAGDRFADAKEEALRLLRAKAPAQRGQIIALGGQVQIVTQPTAREDQLQSALDSIQVGDGHASFGELARAVRSLADANRGPVNLHLFSDFQRSAMPSNFVDMALPPEVRLSVHPANAGDAIPNWTVESVTAPAQLSDPKDLSRSRVRATVAGFNTPAATKTVELVVNDRTLVTKSVNVPANGRGIVEFSPLDVGYGFNRCEVRILDRDSLPGDDAFLFSVRRSDPERVLFVHAAHDTRSTVYFGAALKSSPQAEFILQSVAQEHAADIDPSRFAFVVLSDSVALPAILEHSLAQYVEKGGSVLIALGTDAARGARIPLWGGSVSQAHDYARGGTSVAAGQIDFAHPAVLDPLPGKDNGGWADVRFHYADVVEARDARVAARLSDGTPLILDKKMGQGKILLFASGFDNLTNDLPLHPVFVAFVDRIARYLSGEDRVGGSMVVDAYVQLHPGVSEDGSSSAVEVIDPAGHRPLSLSEARTVQTLRLGRAGFYRIRFADGHESLVGVNPDRLESDLQPMPNDLEQLWSAGSPGNRPQAGRTNEEEKTHTAVPLWWYVMLLALMVAFAEMILASNYLGTQREEV